MSKKKSSKPRVRKPNPQPKPPVSGGRRPGPKRAGVGGLDAAATVLTGSAEPMGCKQLVAEMTKRRLWATKGKTPAATIGAALGRDIQQKKEQSRFRKVGPGLFTLHRKGAKP